MKKIISFVLLLTVALSLAACGSTGQEATEAATKVFMAGYARVDITPRDPGVNMRGFGDEKTRLSEGHISRIYADALAVRDEEGNTAVLMSLDSCNLGGAAFPSVLAEVSDATGLPEAFLAISCIHQHSTPDPGSHRGYLDMLKKKAVEAANAAIADLAPATMEMATVQTEKLNFVRHYIMNDGTYAGDNFGDKSSGYKEHVSQADNSLQLIKFKRDGEKKDVLLTNFQGHPHMGSMKYYNEIHSDTVGVYRDTVTDILGCEVIYFSGAGGNVKMTSMIEGEQLTDDFKEHGKMLARYAVAAEGTYAPLATGAVRATQSTFTATVDHTEDGLVGICQQIYDEYQLSGNKTKAMALAEGLNISSYYHASAILSKAKMGDSEDIVGLGAIGIGELGIAVVPYEMFDMTGKHIKENSPFAMTVVCTLANGSHGYFPNDSTFDYGGYEADTSRYIRGTAEQLADRFLEMLRGLK